MSEIGNIEYDYKTIYSDIGCLKLDNENILIDNGNILVDIRNILVDIRGK